MPTPAAPSITTRYGVIISDADDAADEAADEAADVAREQGCDHAHPSALQGGERVGGRRRRRKTVRRGKSKKTFEGEEK